MVYGDTVGTKMLCSKNSRFIKDDERKRERKREIEEREERERKKKG